MSFKVNNTVVIDNSRNIVNVPSASIGTVSISGAQITGVTSFPNDTDVPNKLYVLQQAGSGREKFTAF